MEKKLENCLWNLTIHYASGGWRLLEQMIANGKSKKYVQFVKKISYVFSGSNENFSNTNFQMKITELNIRLLCSIFFSRNFVQTSLQLRKILENVNYNI